mmetsp:Transcript_6398/g.9709  ORF Transcript_6398/g.9709 Transcript_6398/m.9709 type:complete len:345 (-) Transcript_6398:51-1085(-)
MFLKYMFKCLAALSILIQQPQTGRSLFTSTAMKFVAVGSGSSGLQLPEVCEAIVVLAGKPAHDLNVLYVGTATYDLPKPRENQTKRLAEMGCTIQDLIVGPGGPDAQEGCCEAKFKEADIIVVSGGNTLFAVEMWKAHGIHHLMRSAMERGCVMAGGSAGAICWFDGGHSDSADPDSFKEAMLLANSASQPVTDESESAPPGGEIKQWEYIRVPCLGFLPGLVCPHADKVQSNGVLRVKDFDQMMLRHPGERGICIDHFAALIIDGETYSVLSAPGQPGSVLDNQEYSESREGKPGIWTKQVKDGQIITSLVPGQGQLSDLLVSAEEIIEDPRLDAIRNANPIS